jgi:NAD(P)H-hydrate repair Nnr-like enzyme with NAD(P)H-hydrate dehydratase domain
MHEYISRQTKDKPLFPDLIWSRPENKLHAGKLLIIGGNAQEFAAAAEAYGYAHKAGGGTIRVLLPDSLQKTVSKIFPAAEFAPSTPGGSLSQNALAELLAAAMWADGVLIAGDLGRNSETAILLEKFANKYHGQLSVTRDSADYFTKLPDPVINREETTLVISLSQLQKLFVSSKQTKAIALSMNLINLAEALHDFTKSYPISVITRHQGSVVTASSGQISLSKTNEEKIWRLKTASTAAVWWLQNPNLSFEALTSSVIS